MTPILTRHVRLTPAEGGNSQARLVELPAVITFAATPDALVDAAQEYLLDESPAMTSRGEGVPLRFVLTASRPSAAEPHDRPAPTSRHRRRGRVARRMAAHPGGHTSFKGQSRPGLVLPRPRASLHGARVDDQAGGRPPHGGARPVRGSA